MQLGDEFSEFARSEVWGQGESGDAPEQPGEREAFNARVEALRVAREHVRALTEEKNSRGYLDSKLAPAERIAQELKVARYLLGEE